MTLAVDDPLIEGMTIARPLPLHESNRRLRALYPECPRMYGVAVMAEFAVADVTAPATDVEDANPFLITYWAPACAAS